MHEVLWLDVPPMPCVVDADVFDAWSWCASDRLAWPRPRDFRTTGRIGSENPSGLAFVLHGDASFLPTELASLHVPGARDDERVLAPWAIDDATDGFHARGVRPRDVLRLHASSLEALVWGLHDWVHFHNHGPFDRPAMTELQCDLIALAWLRRNGGAIGLTPLELSSVAHDLAALSRARFAAEGIPPCDFDRLFSSEMYPASLA
jgi:hypothetical protein